MAKLPETARIIFEQALADCSVEQATASRFHVRNGLLHIDEEGIELSSLQRIRIVAVGKSRERDVNRGVAAIACVVRHRHRRDRHCAGAFPAASARIPVLRRRPSFAERGFVCRSAGGARHAASCGERSGAYAMPVSDQRRSIRDDGTTARSRNPLGRNGGIFIEHWLRAAHRSQRSIASASISPQSKEDGLLWQLAARFAVHF